MNKLWIMINALEINRKNKNRLFLSILIIINIFVGATIWIIAGRLLLPGVYGLICFMIYPAYFIGFMGGAFYLYKHEF